MSDTYGNGTPLHTIKERNLMESKSQFPAYADTESALCFMCQGKLDSVKKSDYPTGRGGYVGHCEKCHYLTWFDVDPDCLKRQRLSSKE